MSLITRCPACGTMFKVVTDQLKVSQGWVRCGQCTEVFDAAANLLPRHATPRPPIPSVQTPEEVSSLPASPAPEPPVESLPEVIAVEPLLAGNPAQPESGPAPDDMPPDSAADFDPASWKQALQARQQGAFTAPPSPDAAELRTPDGPAAADSDFADAEAAPDVSFVRDARRQAFWRKPLVRLALGFLLLLLLALLALQWVMQRKDTLAALEPRLTPLLQMLCSQMGCEIAVPRHIESLVIDSSTFKKLGPDTYRLSFALKNTGVTPLEMPSLEVTLTDTQDQVVVRRVLAPAQFGAVTTTLAAQSELAGTVTLRVASDAGRSAAPPGPAASVPSAGPLRVAGYRVLAFYP